MQAHRRRLPVLMAFVNAALVIGFGGAWLSGNASAQTGGCAFFAALLV